MIAALAFGFARFAREAADRPDEITPEPYAPSPAAAPIVTLGYREVAADLLWIRFRGYFGGTDSTADALAALADAIVALDPRFKQVYTHAPMAMTLADHGVSQATYHRALAVLERGMAEFPDDWKLPNLAGQIYTQDLVTTDPAQRRAWDEKGTLLVESAIRKPGAPAGTATWVAMMRTKLGQHERAVSGLREMLLVTTDKDVRKRLLDKLAKLEDENADEIAAEIYEARHKFDAAWERDRPAIRPSFYVLLGPRIKPGFDLTDLATGGRDLTVTDGFERLEPLTDPSP